jgi:hypothetical protein
MRAEEGRMKEEGGRMKTPGAIPPFSAFSFLPSAFFILHPSAFILYY